MARVAVTAPWIQSYPDPIAFRAGDPVRLTGRTDDWDGHRWVWAVAPDGREGWIPDSVAPDGVALQDYSALELTCAVDELLEAVTVTHGWTWCRNGDGTEGWVPDRCLRALP